MGFSEDFVWGAAIRLKEESVTLVKECISGMYTRKSREECTEDTQEIQPAITITVSAKTCGL